MCPKTTATIWINAPTALVACGLFQWFLVSDQTPVHLSKLSLRYSSDSISSKFSPPKTHGLNLLHRTPRRLFLLTEHMIRWNSSRNLRHNESSGVRIAFWVSIEQQKNRSDALHSSHRMAALHSRLRKTTLAGRLCSRNLICIHGVKIRQHLGPKLINLACLRTQNPFSSCALFAKYRMKIIRSSFTDRTYFLQKCPQASLGNELKPH